MTTSDSLPRRDGLAPPDGLAAPITLPVSLADVEQVRSVCTPVRLEYTYTPGRALSQYLRAMKTKRILGEECPVSGQVFVPPSGVSPLTGQAITDVVELPDTGYVDSFNITRVPIPRRPDLQPPYCSAWIVLDGASVGFLGLVINIDPKEVRIGMRVRAEWKPDSELEESAANIIGWVPTGEPDEKIDDYERLGRATPPTRPSSSTQPSSSAQSASSTSSSSSTQPTSSALSALSTSSARSERSAPSALSALSASSERSALSTSSNPPMSPTQSN